jgi:transposase
MSETLTVKLNLRTASKLRRLAAKEGGSLETLVQRLLEDLTAELGGAEGAPARLSDPQVEDLRKRAKSPGPFATAKEVAAVLSKFKA